MKHRHAMKKRAEGGSVVPNSPQNETDGEPKDAGGSPGVKKEAKAKKAGFVDGGTAKSRMDRPARKSGGRVGSDKSPLSASSSANPMTSAGKC